MNKLLPSDQAGAWQLISGNINRQCSADMFVIAEKLLTPVCARGSFSELRDREGPKRDVQPFFSELFFYYNRT